MNLSLSIARRYLLGKKTTNVINIITWISIGGLAIGTAALILILSVFNGFESILGGLYNAYNADLQIKPVKGKFLELDSVQLAKISNIPGVLEWSGTLEEIALFEYKGSQEAGLLRGVDSRFTTVTDIEQTIVRGNFQLEDKGIFYTVAGRGMYSKLSINPADGITPITVYVPSKTARGPLAKDFRSLSMYPAGYFSISGEEDAQLLIASIGFVRQLLNFDDQLFSTLEIRTDLSTKSEKSIRTELSAILGENIDIKNKREQNETFLKIMNIEKWVSFLIACLTLSIISFNMVGSLWMIVMDKKKDISVLKSMGFSAGGIRALFIKVGLFIGLYGYIIGSVFALVIYRLHKKFHLITVPGAYSMDAFPLEIKWLDFVLVAITVALTAFIASLLPSARAAAVSAFVKYE
jgi:lipoprotein-releasing system permease protein